MATSPRPTTPPPPPKPNPTPPPKPAAEREPREREHHAEREHERAEHEKAERPQVEDREKTPFDDPDQKTIQEEQLERSAEIEAMGVEKWKEEHDERKGADKPAPQHGGQVPGVSPTQKDDPGGRR